MTGGDLRFHINRKTFMEEAVRFWIAELGCALKYIHGQGIVHRDVKPDNVLLDCEGHVHLADFNVASDIPPHKPLTSKSGTLAYLAPEVYAGKGYLSEVDWWSLGVLFYECIYNKRPFEAGHPDILAQAILKAEPAFPVTSPPVSMPCLHAISSLLEKDKKQRIGAASFGSFTDNPFFREIDFDALERKEIEPVFCPPSEKTNFDATYDLEELLLEEAPLEARARKQKPRAELRDDATQQEIRADELHRMIETMFEPFNYTLLPQQRDPANPGLATVPTSSATTPSRSPRYAHGDKPPVDPMPYKYFEQPRSIPTPRSQTPRNLSRTRSSTHSPNGSPPFPASALSSHNFALSPSHMGPPADFFLPNPTSDPSYRHTPTSKPRPAHHEDYFGPSPTATLSGGVHPAALSRPARPRPNMRSTSMGGGIPVVALNDPVAWSDVAPNGQGAHSSAITPTDEQRRFDRPPGMLGFLSRNKRGRDRSPKPAKERERGVLGKEGARVIISHG